MDDGNDRVTLVCVRDSRRHGLEVLLQETLAGNGSENRMSFPGCPVEDDDCALPVLERCYVSTGNAGRGALGRDMRHAHDLGWRIAGVRCLLGNTGLLFAASGAQRRPELQRLSSAERQAVSHNAKALTSYLAQRDLYCDLNRLHLLSRWADSHDGRLEALLLVQVPDRLRFAGYVWRDPGKVLVSWRRRELLFDFSTFLSLRSLSDFTSCEFLLAEYP